MKYGFKTSDIEDHTFWNQVWMRDNTGRGRRNTDTGKVVAEKEENGGGKGTNGGHEESKSKMRINQNEKESK